MEDGYLNDVAGVFVIGPNGNNIFVPSAGTKEPDGTYGKGHKMCFWSSTLCFSCVDGSLVEMVRDWGMVVRPVKN